MGVGAAGCTQHGESNGTLGVRLREGSDVHSCLCGLGDLPFLTFFDSNSANYHPAPPQISPSLCMPLAAGFGVGAVVSAFNHYLKPREAAQRAFGNEYQLGRTSDFVVESILPGAAGAAPRCVVYSPSHTNPVDGSRLCFSVACASTKLVTPAAAENRFVVGRACALMVSRSFIHVFCSKRQERPHCFTAHVILIVLVMACSRMAATAARDHWTTWAIT